MKKWEYIVRYEQDYYNRKQLAKFGIDGWELVSHLINPQVVNPHEYIFKRELIE